MNTTFAYNTNKLIKMFKESRYYIAFAVEFESDQSPGLYERRWDPGRTVHTCFANIILMAQILRPNKVVVVLNGRYAGKKAVILKNMF